MANHACECPGCPVHAGGPCQNQGTIAVYVEGEAEDSLPIACAWCAAHRLDAEPTFLVAPRTDT